MKHRWTITRAHHHVALPLAGLFTAFIVGCGQLSSPDDAPADAGSRLSSGPTSQGANAIASVGDDLGRLRAVTARFQDFAEADPGGYSAQLTGCMSDATLGGMGVHFGKETAIDAVADPLEPEVLLYEPQANGRYRLVAVEFVIPYTLRPRNGPPPTLFGQSFHQFDDFQLWGLHAWIWRDNPAGMFADWNPNVGCDAAPAASRMSHAGK